MSHRWTTNLLRLPRLIGFALFYVGELVLSNLRLARDILTRPIHARPAVIAVPLDELNDLQLLALNNLVTMTPGTLSLDISDDRRMLFIHAMYVSDPDAFRREIKEQYEKKIKEVLG